MLTGEAKKAGYAMAQTDQGGPSSSLCSSATRFPRWTTSTPPSALAAFPTLQLLNRLTEEYKKQNKAEAPPLPIAEKPAEEAKKAGAVLLVQRR